MNTICKFVDIDTYLLYFIDIKTVISLITISKDQYNHMINLDFVKQLCSLVQKHECINIIDNAAFYNYLSLIKWISESSVWENEFKYSSYAIAYAADKGYVDILQWFAKSKHEFKYTAYAIDIALIEHKLESLKWFDESKYEIKYSPKIIKEILKGDCTDIYDYLGPNSRIIKILDLSKN